MPETNKLKRIIEFARDKGWMYPSASSDLLVNLPKMMGRGYLQDTYWNGILFSHDFAKAVFGFEQMLDVKGLCIHCGGEIKLANPSGFCNHVHYPEGCDICLAKTQDWKYHIQQAVISEDPKEYYYKYVENKQRGKEAK